MAEKMSVTSQWQKVASNKGTILNISYNNVVYITTSENKPDASFNGIDIRPRKYHSAYVTSDTEFIWIKCDGECEVEVANFI